MNTQRTAARLRALARQLILEAEVLEAIAAPEPKPRDWRQDLAKLKHVRKSENRGV